MGRYDIKRRLGGWVFIGLLIAIGSDLSGARYEIGPATVGGDEEFERIANQLRAGDELVLKGGTYSQTGRRAATAKGTAEQPIVIRAAKGEKPLLTRPADNIDRHNNIEFVDCEYLIVRGLQFKGGSSGVRFIRGHHVTFEDCEISHTGNNALTMNSGNCDHFIVRRNHIHHTGLSTRGPTEGEGMYIGCHNGSCITTDSVFEGNYIHHTRGTSGGGNDGIEIKFGSYNNVIRNNVIHDTNLGKQYPGIFVYGSNGKGVNLVEGNVIWKAGEGIQAVSDAVIRNNIIFDCSIQGITASPHGAAPKMQNTTIVNNTIVNHPRGIRIRWGKAKNMVLANNAIYCPNGVAIDAAGITNATCSANYVTGRLNGVAIDNTKFMNGGDLETTFVNSAQQDFWLTSGSALLESADPEFAPKFDFNGRRRKEPFDVGAYETDSGETNPGWKIQAGFKNQSENPKR